MKKFLGCLLMLMLLTSCALAEISGISVMDTRYKGQNNHVYMELRALDGTGSALKLESGEYSFVAENVADGGVIELPAERMDASQKGHIIVVDLSRYYFGRADDYITVENIQEIVKAYLSSVDTSERVMFVLATDAEQPTVTQYMTVEQAQSYASGLAFNDKTKANINEAIYKAFETAANPPEGTPMFNSVFVVADPDTQSNGTPVHSLVECAYLHTTSSRIFDVIVATVYREAYMRSASNDRRDYLNIGMAQYKDFAAQCSGAYVEVPHVGKSVTTDALRLSVSKLTGTSIGVDVDLSVLNGSIPKEPEQRTIPLTIYCTHGGNTATRKVDVSINTAQFDAMRTPVPENTPTPAPTPVVVMGQSGTKAVQFINALIKMGYLNEGTYETFDSNCMRAYIEYCNRNGLDPDKDIDEKTYNTVINLGGLHAPTPTPGPTPTPEAATPTPVPTIPPEGYRINDCDTEDNGGFISQMQNVLKKLNCYEENAVTSIGRMDEATIAAVAKYCKNYNWTNEIENGVSGSLCAHIIDSADNKPIEQTSSEKLKAFFMGATVLFNVAIPNWALVAVCVVLVLGIIIAVILTHKDSEPKPAPDMEIDPIPEGDDGIVKRIQADIGFRGARHNTTITLQDGRLFAIRRRVSEGDVGSEDELLLSSEDKCVSRDVHATLMYHNGDVYLSDKSKYHTVMVNGEQIVGRESQDGVIVCSGDEITVGEHSIFLRW